MKMQETWSWKNLGDVVTNECLGKCVRMCLTDIQVAESQSIMEKPEGKMCFIISCQIFYGNRVQNNNA